MRIAADPVVPDPHPGLILLLGRFNPKPRPDWPSSILDTSALEKLIDPLLNAGKRDVAWINSAGHLREEILKTNWGPILVAVEHHRPTLTHCWIVCTKGERGSKEQFETANKLVSLFSDKSVIATQVVLENAFDIAECTLKMQHVFQGEVPRAGLYPEQVIADITGGTVPMSGGVLAAGLPESRHMEYLRQDKELFDALTRKSLTSAQIANDKVLVRVSTHPQRSEAPALASGHHARLARSLHRTRFVTDSLPVRQPCNEKAQLQWLNHMFYSIPLTSGCGWFRRY